ncbi:Ku protein [Xaviernesmea oryzae]|uniref:Non-homologous end joining protein Ku n=1 Tax=Xaviernesmea oryzae TaxID=464029 RepID=A0A1Q9AUN0_9HYPH|nr:Ku protein [Xaviernesmea oryzae]OLP59104.1 Ku protein [Xaviernesmea oryzae]SEK86472.1 DNA end-binding protein Ku [Xaviernesmea oryzae]
MAPRANWKGHLKLGEMACAVALYTAASTSERISFHMLNRKTGNRLHREFVDSETGAVVEHDDQVKGYALSENDFVVLEPEEVAAAVPDSDKMLAIEAFLPSDEIDDVYFDKPYYLAPADPQSRDVFALVRDALAKKKVAAIARTVLFRRLRTVLIRPHEDGLVAFTLNYDYEVRPSAEVFADLPEVTLKGEMLDLATHIIKTKMGRFDPSTFDDRYENALGEVIKAKIEGRKIKKPPEPERGKVIDLMEALRQSAGAGSAGQSSRAAEARSAKGKAEDRKAATKATRTKATRAKASAGSSRSRASSRKAG